MSYGRFIAVIAGRPVAFLTALGGVVLAVLLGTWLMQPRYVAKADVIVEPRGWVAGQIRDTSFVATEADLLRSERVAIAALRQLNLQKDPALLDKWKEATGGRGDFEAWATEQLSKKLDIKPGRDSNMLSVTYSSPDPEVAAKTVNAFVKAYVDTARQIREETAAQSSESFSDRTKSLKAAVQQAETKLASFQQENGVVFTDEKLDVETLRLAELNAQLVALQSNAAAAAGRQQEAAARGSGMQEVLGDRLVATLSADLARQEGRLEELRSRAGDQNPALIEQRSVVNALRRGLDAATARATSSIAAESRIAAQRAGTLQAALTAQRAKVLEVKAKRDQAQVLQRELDLARKAFDSAVTKSNESMLDSGASRGNVTIVKAATVPHSPALPRPAVNLAASIVMGLLAAIAVVFWRESRDRRLRQDEDVAGQLDLPLLGVISGDRRTAGFLKLASRS
jgi:chain length determinant protein EpsF